VAILINAKDGLNDHYTVICSSYFPIDTDAPLEPSSNTERTETFPWCWDVTPTVTTPCGVYAKQFKRQQSCGISVPKRLNHRQQRLRFSAAEVSSVIDLTVCKPSVLNTIHGWAVCEETSMFDHRHKLFSILRRHMSGQYRSTETRGLLTGTSIERN